MNKLNLELRIMVGLFILLYIGQPLKFVKAEDVGLTGCNFLKLPISGELYGLGGAGAASYFGVASLWLNPAGIYNREKIEITSSYGKYILETAYHTLASSYKLKDLKLAFGYTYLYSNFNKVTLSSGELKEKNWGTSDLLLQIGFAKPILEETTLGLSLKLIRERLYNYSDWTNSLDLGLVHEYLKDRLYLGIVVKNIWGNIKFKKDSFPLPRAVRLGSSLKFADTVFNLDIEKGLNAPIVVLAGVRNCVFKDLFYINLGYNAKAKEPGNFSGGFKFKAHPKLIIYYTFLPQAPFSQRTHILSFDIRL